MSTITLADLDRASGVLKIAAISQAAGMGASTLPSRIRRGTPELTADEQRRIAEVLGQLGVAIVPGETA